MKTIDLTRYQNEVGEWSKRNFSNRQPIDPAEGISEEFGELCHARLKRRQGIRGTVAEHDAAEKDAIADMGIYLMDLAAQANVTPIAFEKPDSLNKNFTDQHAVAELGCLVTELLYDLVMHGSGYIRENIRNVAVALDCYASTRGWDFVELLDATWSVVRTRNWLLYPGTGRPPGEEAA